MGPAEAGPDRMDSQTVGQAVTFIKKKLQIPRNSLSWDMLGLLCQWNQDNPGPCPFHLGMDA
ncbi:MAG: hypothetical protein DWQ01_14615 [Planctomycetota bacterium]|nr:MAG: hypothetical protein DWQ01_14615 [Planctomycetota bacterium]